MQKYGVETSRTHTKTGQQGCPRCGSTLETGSNVPLCPKCGTAPFEEKACAQPSTSPNPGGPSKS